LAGRKASFTDSQPLLADLGTPTECGKTYSGPWAAEVGSLEVEMAWKWEEIGTRSGKVIGMIWFTGLALFVLELGAGLDYVQARLASLMPGFVGFLPALAIAAWKVMETAFWNYAELERTFRIVPFATLPFLLVGVALWLRNKMIIQRQQRTKSEQR
jgi:hypothetical protein